MFSPATSCQRRALRYASEMALSLFPPSLVTARLAARNTPPPVATSHLPNRNPNLLLESPSSSSAPTALQCPHFQSCSGCSYEWNLDQPPVLQEASKFFRDRGVQDFTFDSGRLWEWRCRAKLAVRGTPESPLIGLYQEGTHNVVDIPLCRAHHPNINAAVELLKQGISKLNVQPYDEDVGTGDLRYVQMAVTTYNTSLPVAERYQKGKVQLSLVWNSRNEHSENSNKLHALSNFLWGNGGPSSNTHLIHSIWANFQTSTSNIIFGNRWRHLLGERDFWEHIGGVDISLDPSSFGQANTLEPLYWLKGSDVVVVDPPRKGLHPSLIDALCNVAWSDHKSNEEPRGSILKVKDEKRPWILRAREASVHIDSKTAWEKNQTWPETLIYISCRWESFKEDCRALLSSKAWHLEKAHAFNLFPGTESIEVLGVFKRGPWVGQKKKKRRKTKRNK
ncbi:uncharacterized protein [Elaeis guineensis]|uniref:Uncharacterized protein LOC105048923 isoform X3 n=1 Tax=Elaeis guineensis var. tenera TaxID=51953 RepID=A0A6I9RHT3_ELAGV|nr:uncharacterized protein LOC105048923 isoform X3 [Elaeis guineensis]